jgi:acyl-CoA thioesterase
MSNQHRLMDVVTKGSTPPPCDETLGIKVIYAENGVARGVWQVDGALINGNGVIMGGFISAAADIMMAYAIASCLQEGQGFASINLHTTFHRPAFTGEIEVEARVERMGKSVAYLVATLVQEGKEIAVTTSSVMIF